MMDYTKLRDVTVNVSRQGNVDLVTGTDGKIIPLCHVISLGPFSSSLQQQAHISFYLAIKHLNNGDGSVIRVVEGLNKTCPIRFTLEGIDTKSSQSVAAKQIIEIFSHKNSTKDRPLPCAFLGAGRSSVSISTSMLTSIFGYPQISWMSTSPVLDEKDHHALFGRTIPSDDTIVELIVDYFNQKNIQHFGILYQNDAYGNNFAQAFQSHAIKENYLKRITLVSIPAENGSGDDYKEAIGILENTQFRYFLGIFIGQNILEKVMLEASKQNILGNGFTWILTDGVSPDDFIFGKDSELHSSIKKSGVYIFKASGWLPGSPISQKYQDSWKAIDESESGCIENTFNSSSESALISEVLKKPIDPSVAFAYDAMIALGISACNSIDNTPFNLNGTKNYINFLKSTFDGVSGNVSIDAETGSRIFSSTFFKVTKIRPVYENEHVAYYIETVIEIFNTTHWGKMDSDLLGKHPDLPEYHTDENHIGTFLRVVGLSMAAITMIMSIGFLYWTFTNRNQKVVKASQPQFLYMISIGTILMGTSIIPLSFDSEVLSESNCSIACMAMPWLLSNGFSMSCSAIFAKTWRLNKLFYNPDLRRIQATVKEVIAPTVILLTLNIFVLLFWTIWAPWTWRRTVKENDIFNRPVSILGYCTSTSGRWFWIPLIFLNMFTLLIALHQLYRARLIKMEFGESHYMAAAASGMFLVLAFGIPVNIIASGNARAEYFVSISIIFAICVLLSLFIFIPKIKFHSKILKGKKSMRNIVRKFAEQSKFAAQKTKKKEEKKYLTRLDVSENKQHARSIRLADENPQRVKTLNDFDATIPIEGSDA